MFPLLFLYIWVKELALEGEWEMERIALKPLSERRNFLLGSYMGILKDSSIAMRSINTKQTQTSKNFNPPNKRGYNIHSTL